MTPRAAWRDVFIERLRATGNVTLAAAGAGVSRQHVYKARNRSKAFRRAWGEALEQAMDRPPPQLGFSSDEEGDPDQVVLAERHRRWSPVRGAGSTWRLVDQPPSPRATIDHGATSRRSLRARFRSSRISRRSGTVSRASHRVRSTLSPALLIARSIPASAASAHERKFVKCRCSPSESLSQCTLAPMDHNSRSTAANRSAASISPQPETQSFSRAARLSSNDGIVSPVHNDNGCGRQLARAQSSGRPLALGVRDAIAASITTLPEQLRRSLAWDQGAEMAQHAQLRIDTGLPIYFCDPHSPWQRGNPVEELLQPGRPEACRSNRP